MPLDNDLMGVTTMKYKIPIVILIVLITAAGLIKYKTPNLFENEPKKLSHITYDRNHGSLWGIQFHIEMNEKEIIYAHFFQPGENDLTELYSAGITQEQWNFTMKWLN